MPDKKHIGFEALAKKVAENYKGKKVKPKYQKEYGKTYSKEEAEEVGNKVAGKMKAQMMGEGGEIINLIPLNFIPLSTQLSRLNDGEGWAYGNYKNEDGSDATSNEGNVIVSVRTGKKFRLPKRIVNYVDGYEMFINKKDNTIRTYPQNIIVARINGDKLDVEDGNNLYIDKSKLKREFENGYIPFSTIEEIKSYDKKDSYAEGGEIKSDYKIVDGFDHYRNRPLYQVIYVGDNEDIEYDGEWHTDREDAEKELKGLTETYAEGGEIEKTKTAISKLQKIVDSTNPMVTDTVKENAKAKIKVLEAKLHESKESKSEEKSGGDEYKSKTEKDLEKELRRLQRDLNSRRLLIYREGDNSEEEKERKKEREVKLTRFNEVLALLNKKEWKEAKAEHSKLSEKMKMYIPEITRMTATSNEAVEKFIKDNDLSEDDVYNLMQGLGQKKLHHSEFVTALVGTDKDFKNKFLKALREGKKMDEYKPKESKSITKEELVSEFEKRGEGKFSKQSVKDFKEGADKYTTAINYILDKGFTKEEAFDIYLGFAPKCDAEFELTGHLYDYTLEGVKRYIDMISEAKEKGVFEAGFKYLQFGKGELEKLGLKSIGIIEFDDTNYKGEKTISKRECYVSDSCKTIMFFEVGSVGEGGYSGLYSFDEKEGMKIIKGLLDNTKNYVKDIDVYYNNKIYMDEKLIEETLKKCAKKEEPKPKTRAKKEVSFNKTLKFRKGDLVYNVSEKEYGIVLDNYGDSEDGNRGEIRLDSSGNTSIFKYNKDYSKEIGYNLVPFGSKEDVGKESLDSIKKKSKMVIDSVSDKKDKERYEDIYNKLLSGYYDRFKTKSDTRAKKEPKASVKGISAKFEIGDHVYVNYGEEKGKDGVIEKVYTHEIYPKSVSASEIPYYEIKGIGKEISQNNIQLFEKPKEKASKFDYLIERLKKKPEYKGKLENKDIDKGHKRDLKKDLDRTAKKPGKRISKDGEIYYESRENRSDVNGKNRL